MQRSLVGSEMCIRDRYDRALGIQYMLGVWDLLDRLDEEKNK